MLEVLDKIIEYLTYNTYLNEKEAKERSEKQLKRIVKWVENYSIAFKIGIAPYELRKFRKNINKLKEIRKIYQEGLSFFKNKTKGFKKGYRDRVFSLLQIEIKRGNYKEAKERALDHLDYIKKYKSERSYYYHLKKIRNLGIEI